MDTMSCVDEQEHQVIEKPGVQLAQLREKKGFTQEFVATKLHMRKRLIELLEADAYDQLPQPVFVKGYIRAYAKLLGVDAEPLITSFNYSCVEERKLERTLWQARREPSMHERLVRWVTAGIVLTTVLILTFLWQKSNHFTTALWNQKKENRVDNKPSVATKAYLTQASKIESLFKIREPEKMMSEKKGD